MDKWTSFPSPIKRKVFLSALIGAACLMIGAAFTVVSKDFMTLALSIAICIFSICRSISMYRIALNKKYETVEGICTAVVSKLFGRYRKIKIKDGDGNEVALMLNKQSKVTIGETYRFYFKETGRVTLGNEYFDTALSSDCFIGYEKIDASKQ